MIGAAGERADAARNRNRILEAARALFAERGPARTSIEDIAIAAGVGKGTVFRRFGDRAGLALALLDQRERELQDAFLRGAPPLGPGAPPRIRLIAFGEAMLDNLEINGDVLADVEFSRGGGYLLSPPRQVHRMHVRSLLAESGAGPDPDYFADVLLAPLGPGLFTDQRRRRRIPLARLKADYARLVERVSAGPPAG